MNFLLRGAALNRRSEYDVARHCMPSGRGEARCPISGTNIPHGTVPRGTVAGNQQYHPSPAGSAPGRGMPSWGRQCRTTHLALLGLSRSRIQSFTLSEVAAAPVRGDSASGPGERSQNMAGGSASSFTRWLVASPILDRADLETSRSIAGYLRE